MARRENGGLVASPGTPANAEVISESAEVERMIAAERQGQRNPTISPEHDQTLFNAIEALAGIPGLADQLQNALKGESFLLFSAQISARLRRAGLPPVEAERVQRVMAALATVAAWWPRERQRVQSPADLAALATPLLARREQEELHVAIVDGRNGLLVLHKVYVGTATGTSVRIAELLRPVIEMGGVGFALVHNHPSGDPEPSEEDVRLTAEVVVAARLFDLELLDHLVIGHGRWSSIRSQRPGVWGAAGLPE
ncbi:MAG: JAB domain-containing protein [Candidatus Limnocylindrus sp.]